MAELTNMNEWQLVENMTRIIREDMKDMGYKHKEMAEIIGCSVSSFQNKITHNGARFNFIEIYKLCEELLITVDDLIQEAIEE